MTEEQKECEYCHFDSRGADFANSDDCTFQLAKFTHGRYYVNAWSGDAWSGENFDVDSEFINYCPMCGRKLNKE